MNSANASCSVAPTIWPVSPLCLGKYVDEVPRYDDVTHSNVGVQRFRERADVKHAVCVVGTLQRGHRAPFVMKFAVVVVLDDPGADSSGEPQQRLSTGRRHQQSRRMLVRGRDEYQARGICRRFERHAALIERDALHRRARRFERRPCAAVTRAFDPREVTRIQEHACDERDGRLSGGHQEDLVRIRVDAAVFDEVMQQGPA